MWINLAIVVLVLSAASAYVLHDHYFSTKAAVPGALHLTTGSSSGCPTSTAQPVRLTVASGIAPVVKQVAAAACIPVLVTVSDTTDGGSEVRGNQVDVWIPDSRQRAAVGTVLVSRTSVSVATSPVVLEASKSVAAQLTARGPLSWASLLDHSRFGAGKISVQDPSTSGAVYAVADTLSVLSIQKSHDRFLGLSNAASSLRSMAALKAAQIATPIVAAQMRIVESRLLSTGGAIVDTAEGAPVLDYPWITAKSPHNPAGVKALLAALLGPDGQSARKDVGLLEPKTASISVTAGSKATSMRLSPPASPTAVPTDLLVASVVPLRARVIAVVDVSGSMGDPTAPRQPSPMSVVKQSVPYILNAVTSDTSLSIWKFGSRLTPTRDYQVVTPPITVGSGRKKIDQAIASLNAQQTGTGLYNTVLAAYKQAVASYDPYGGNIVCVFTDGRNQDAPGLDLPGLLAQIKHLRSAKKPVPFLLFGYGSADLSAMGQIAQATGGGVFPIKQANQMVGALIDAVSPTVTMAGA